MPPNLELDEAVAIKIFCRRLDELEVISGKPPSRRTFTRSA
jgi:hypothetical protein